MKKPISVLLVLCLLLAVLPVSGSAASIGQMTDVNGGAWYYEAVSYCLENGYMEGISETRFAPNRSVTRAQVAQVLWNREGSPIAGEEEDKPDNPFQDVAEGVWYYDSVLWCGVNQVVNGTGNGAFSPDQNVTRQDLCAMAYRYFTDYLNLTGRRANAATVVQTYTDWGRTASYATDAVRWAVDSGFMTGTSSTSLSPRAAVTRSQLAQFLMNLDKAVNRPDSELPAQPDQKLGVDISHYNGDVDFDLLKSLGVEFVAIRCGYGSDYKDQDDLQFEQNVRKAEAAGIPWGTYLYSYAKDTEMAESEAEHLFRVLNGRTPPCGVWYDVEDPSQLDCDLISICETFCDAVQQTGMYCGIYSYLYLLQNGLNSPRLDKYPKWVAQWSSVCDYTEDYVAWQFTNKFVINGVDFDGDVAYPDYPGLDFDANPEARSFSDSPDEPDGPGGSGIQTGQGDPPEEGPADQVDRAMGDGYRTLNGE